MLAHAAASRGAVSRPQPVAPRHWRLPRRSSPAVRTVAHASGHEVRGAKLGCIALSDGAALPVAMEQAVPLSARIVMMTNGPAVAKMLEAALLRPEKRLELSVDPAYLMRRQRVPELLSARRRPLRPLAAE